MIPSMRPWAIEGAVSSNEVCPEIEMTVPWGRRERWGVESGRVADFVGLLESAELDASGGYCVISD
jgi:hypothetical protein